MKGKKLFTIALAAAMTVSVGVMSAGCGAQDENTVRIARWALEWEKETFRNWTKEFTEENPDIAIEWEFVPYTAHFDRLRTDLLSSKAADIIFMNNWGWKPYSDIEVFEDLGAVEELSAARSSLLSTVHGLKQGDKFVGLPLGMVSRVPVVNNADFETAGVEVPWDRATAYTGSEMVELLKTAADGAERDRGINITLTDAVTLFCASAGAPIVTPDGKSVGCNTPEGVAAVQNFVDFAKSGYVVPLSENLSGGYGSPDSAILSGRVVAGFCNPGECKSVIDAGYSVSAIPCLKADGGRDTVLADFNTLVMPKFSSSKKAAYRVMNWMLSKEAQLAYAKFADLPTNAEAFEEVMTDSVNWAPELYRAYGVGIDNIFVPPAMSTGFQTYFGGVLKRLLDGNITAAQFCEEMKKGENQL